MGLPAPAPAGAHAQTHRDLAGRPENRRHHRCLPRAGNQPSPGYYLPPDAFAPGVLSRAQGRSVCEFKGAATYWTLSAGGRVAEAAGWSYEDPTPAFREMAGYIAVYPGRMDECRVDGETVVPQPGTFYGGWITSDVVGPFKGEAGTMGW